MPDRAMKGIDQFEQEFNIRVPDTLTIDFAKIRDAKLRNAISRFQEAFVLAISQLLPEETLNKIRNENKPCGPCCTCYNLDGSKRPQIHIEECPPGEIPDEVITALQAFANKLPQMKREARQQKEN